MDILSFFMFPISFLITYQRMSWKRVLMFSISFLNSFEKLLDNQNNKLSKLFLCLESEMAKRENVFCFLYIYIN